MLRIPVDSSDIVAVGYDAGEQLLEIEFRGDRVYQYRDVPATMHEQLMRAESHGQYFNTFIHGHFRFDRIGTDTEQGSPSAAVVFVTANQRKVRNLQAACASYDINVEQLKLPVDEIQSHDAEAIALAKAKRAYKLARRPVVVNDSFWNIVALRGFPGGYMSYVTDWLRADDFVRLMEGKSDRSVVCTDTLVYFDGKRPKIFVTEHMGIIATEPRGLGASIDQVVILQGQHRTIAEMEASGELSVDPLQTMWHDFAKWYSLQRRMRRA